MGETSHLPNLEVRLGGIYALERIAQDSPKDEATIMEVLTAYVRENGHVRGEAAKSGDQPPVPPRMDILAIISVIVRRDSSGEERRWRKVSGQEIKYYPLPSAIDLRDTNLSGADLTFAMLRDVNLRGADLRGAKLRDADLAFSNLSDADLRGADLYEADLGYANLDGADLRGSLLASAQLEMAQVHGADLRANGLTQNMLNNDAHGDKNTKLPDGLSRPGSW